MFDELSEEMTKIFESGQFTKGQHVQKFTSHLSQYTGAKHCFPVTSATTALSACLRALGIKQGDKVAVSDFSFPASSNVIEDLGAVPVFIDVDRDTFNMSVADLRQTITQVKAVIFVDALGNPSGLNDIKALCSAHNVPLIEDAACAIGSAIEQQKVGDIADLTCFSFHPRKLLTTGEGGAVLTNNDAYAKWLRVKLNHGASGKLVGKALEFVDFGFNYRMSEIQALMGWKQILKLDEITSCRNQIADHYTSFLKPLGFKRQGIAKGVYHNIQSLVFTVPDTVSRDGLIEYLAAQNIESTIGTYCLSATAFNQHKYNDIQPNAYWLEQNTITLPCYDGVDVGKVCAAIGEYVG